MKKFLHSHPNIVIGTLAVVLIVVLISFFSWAIGDVFDQMGRALTSPSTQSALGFDLLGASKLNLRGLMDGAAPAPVPTSVPATAAAVTATPVATSASTTTSSSTLTP